CLSISAINICTLPAFSYFIPAHRLLFLFNDTATTETYTLSLHDALPISSPDHGKTILCQELDQFTYKRITSPMSASVPFDKDNRSEEHTSELQSRFDLVCRLLLEKKNKNKLNTNNRTRLLYKSVQ